MHLRDWGINITIVNRPLEIPITKINYEKRYPWIVFFDFHFALINAKSYCC